MTLLRMNQFGKMKMEMIIPEGVRSTLYTKYLKEHQENISKMPVYERFFEECLNICQEIKVDLRSNWKRFYDECDRKKINAKKAIGTEPKRPEPFEPRPVGLYTEEDFWRVERDVLSRPDKWKKLGYIRNPWADFMLTIKEYQLPELYLLYLKSHPEGECPLQDEIVSYHALMKEVFDM